MKRILKFAAIILGTLFFGALGFDCYYHPSFSIALSDSMYPTYKNGDISVILHGETPKIGDVVGYICHNKEKCPNLYGEQIAHRLTAIDSNGCMTIIRDNPKYEWNKLPCFMPKDIDILGVNHKLPF